jgi:hypothetical protein
MMIRPLRFVALVAWSSLLVIACALPCSAPVFAAGAGHVTLSNGDFETGTFEGWGFDQADAKIVAANPRLCRSLPGS